MQTESTVLPVVWVALRKRRASDHVVRCITDSDTLSKMSNQAEITGRYYVLENMAAEAAKLSALARQSPLPVGRHAAAQSTTLRPDRQDEARRPACAWTPRTSVLPGRPEGRLQGPLHRQPAAPRKLTFALVWIRSLSLATGGLCTLRSEDQMSTRRALPDAEYCGQIQMPMHG